MQEPVRIRKSETLSQRVAYGKGALLLSLPFLAVGGILAALGFGGVQLKGANAPMWVIGAFGSAFLLAGLILFGNALRSRRAAARRRAREVAPPWERDLPWDPAGTKDRALARAAHAFLAAFFLAVSLVPFNWWAFLSGKGPLPVEILVGLFDVILLVVLGNACYLLAQFVKYGPSRLGFPRFPYFLGGRLEAVFSPNRFDEIRFTLRCVEERYERSGENTSLSCYELWRAEKTVEPGTFAPEVKVAFDLPDDPELANRLGETPIRYWELAVDAEAPGVDFSTTFVLPVYREPRTAMAAPTA